MRVPALVAALFVLSCGAKPAPLAINPNATLPAPEVKVAPPPGPFNGTVTLTFSTDLPSTIYVSLDGRDPRTTANGRLSGPSPFTLTIDKNTSAQFFASENGKDSDLKQGDWVRAGGPVGTISGVLVTGDFVSNELVGVTRNAQTLSLGTPTAPSERPFLFENLQSGTHRLAGIADRSGDGQLTPFIDYQGGNVSVTLDLTDPFKASAEGVRVYLGTSGTGLGTLRGTITLPKPPQFENLRISVLSPGALGGGLNPQTLLTQLQSGYMIFTSNTQTQYPYVVTDLQPGQYMPVPSLIGFAGGGVAVNLLANPLSPAVVVADQETTADFSFGPVTMSGAVTLGPTSSADAGFTYGIVAARALSFGGVQAVLMPTLFTRNASTGELTGAYAGSSFLANANFSVKVFTSVNGAMPITDALTWVVSINGAAPPDLQVQTTTVDLSQNIPLP